MKCQWINWQTETFEWGFRVLLCTLIRDLTHFNPHFSFIVKMNLINRFKKNLNSSLSKCKDTNEGKLRTYALFKTHFQKEKYLSVIKDIEIRKCFMSFRISSHKLEIERGRYKKAGCER